MLKEQRRLSLSPRLQAVAELVKPGLKLADIGTDHAYLPLFLHKANRLGSSHRYSPPHESALKQWPARPGR